MPNVRHHGQRRHVAKLIQPYVHVTGTAFTPAGGKSLESTASRIEAEDLVVPALLLLLSWDKRQPDAAQPCVTSRQYNCSVSEVFDNGDSPPEVNITAMQPTLDHLLTADHQLIHRRRFH